MKSIDYQGDLAQTCRQMSGQRQVASAAMPRVLTPGPRRRVHKWTAGHDRSAQQDVMGLADQPAWSRWPGGETEAQSTRCCAWRPRPDRFGRINENGPAPVTACCALARCWFVRKPQQHRRTVSSVSSCCSRDGSASRPASGAHPADREMAHFHGDDDIRVTVCCAVIEAKPQDDLARCSVARMLQFRRRNATGASRVPLRREYPTPVVPRISP